jgi:hypothetical protein
MSKGIHDVVKHDKYSSTMKKTQFLLVQAHVPQIKSRWETHVEQYVMEVSRTVDVLPIRSNKQVKMGNLSVSKINMEM